MTDKKQTLIELLCKQFGDTQFGRLMGERDLNSFTPAPIFAKITQAPVVPDKFSETYCAGLCVANEQTGYTFMEALKALQLYCKANTALMDLVNYLQKQEEASKEMAEQSTDRIPRW